MPEQESVWDYPRPPALQEVAERVRIEFGDLEIASSTRALRVLETSHPPTIYIHPQDILPGVLIENDNRSFCEWKGMAHYYDVVTSAKRIGKAAWYYPKPSERYAKLANFVAFYPGLMTACFVGDERVQAQEGDFYGGWITSKIKGPFKGGPGTSRW